VHLCGSCHHAYDALAPDLLVVPHDLDVFFEAERGWQASHPQLRFARPPITANEAEPPSKGQQPTSGGLYHCYMVQNYLGGPDIPQTRIRVWHGDPGASSSNARDRPGPSSQFDMGRSGVSRETSLTCGPTIPRPRHNSISLEADTSLHSPNNLMLAGSRPFLLRLECSTPSESAIKPPHTSTIHLRRASIPRHAKSTLPHPSHHHYSVSASSPCPIHLPTSRHRSQKHLPTRTNTNPHYTAGEAIRVNTSQDGILATHLQRPWRMSGYKDGSWHDKECEQGLAAYQCSESKSLCGNSVW
jgi:hypothetical protein